MMRQNCVVTASVKTNCTAATVRLILKIGTDESPQHVIASSGQWKHLKPRSRSPATILHLVSALRHDKLFRSDTIAGILKWLEPQVPHPQRLSRSIVAATAASKPFYVAAPNAIVGWLPILPPHLAALQRSSGVRPGFFEDRISKSLDQIGLLRMTGT